MQGEPAEVGRLWNLRATANGEETYQCLALVGHQRKPKAVGVAVIESPNGDMTFRRKEYDVPWRAAIADCDQVMQDTVAELKAHGFEPKMQDQPFYVQFVPPPPADWTMERIHKNASERVMDIALKGADIPMEYALFVPPAEGRCMRVAVAPVITPVQQMAVKRGTEELGNLHRFYSWIFGVMIVGDIHKEGGTETLRDRPVAMVLSAEAAGRSWATSVPAITDLNGRIISFLPEDHWAVTRESTDIEHMPTGYALEFRWPGIEKLRHIGV